MSDADRRRRLRAVLARLKRAYGPARRSRRGSGVDALVGTILSQNTSAANSSAGFERLRKLGDWDAVADAPVGRIERAIRVSGLSRIKAPRIRRILRRLRRDRGRIDLQFLREAGADEAFEYLVGFDGVGPKTALCVLLFAFGKEVFPVDTHVHRLARRLGALDDSVPAGRAHQVLTPLIDPPDRYAMHVLLIAHGREVCRARSPLCGRCVLASLCAFGRRQAGSGKGTGPRGRRRTIGAPAPRGRPRSASRRGARRA